jgi:succinate-semialdehyde dehydrogenase / glutarate-semialdehyde dehydrogenase
LNMKFTTINPTTEELIGEYQLMEQSEALRTLDACNSAFKNWRSKSVAERTPYFYKLAEVLREHQEEWAGLMTEEMGKPITEARAEIEKCAWACDVYSNHAEKWLQDEIVEADGVINKVVFQPLGVIVAIMPWNFPFWQAFRFGIPTLLAGNTSILKHSNVVPKCALAIEQAFSLAGFPENAFRSLLLDHNTTARLIESDIVQGVSLTGSTGAGARIGEMAGKHLKKIVLELGGSDPFIVLEDADINVTAANAVKGRFMNCGQSCVASKRFLVHEDVVEEFSQKFAQETKKIVLGDPDNEDTSMGPLVNKQTLDEIEEQLQDALDKGAKILAGGKKKSGIGYFIEPTVLTNTRPDMKVVAEEVFGPIAPIISVKNEEEAIEIANNSEFGLAGSVWTRDLSRGEKIAMQIESGIVFVNSIAKSDPRMPFGGIKKSGTGRELGRYGLMEFVNAKGVNIYENQ